MKRRTILLITGLTGRQCRSNVATSTPAVTTQPFSRQFIDRWTCRYSLFVTYRFFKARCHLLFMRRVFKIACFDNKSNYFGNASHSNRTLVWRTVDMLLTADSLYWVTCVE